MSIKSKIPQIIYTSLKPITKRVETLSTFFERNDTENKEDKNAAKQKGYEEHLKNEVRQQEDTKTTVDRLVRKSNRQIISIDAFSFFPFGLYKNTIEVEESRVIFIFKQPFSFQSHSVDISDISNVFIDSAFFFAKMQIVSRTFTQNDITIGYLNNYKADKVRRIIEGLRTFSRNKIDTSVYEVDELIATLEELHRAR